MKDGLYKIAAGTPAITLGNTKKNAKAIIDVITKASEREAKLLVLPELCVSGYTAGDLFLLDSLISGSVEAIDEITQATENLDMLVVLGAPIIEQGKLYSCAVFISRGRVLGIVPKRNIPNYSEFYEGRMFSAFDGNTVVLETFNCPFGSDIIFKEKGGALTVAAEVCEDLWVPDSPSTRHALNGALVICNTSASNETISKAEYRRSLISIQSAKLCATYIYSDAGAGESTTDTVYAGHNLIAENGSVLAEGKLFKDELIVVETDISHLSHDRRRLTSFKSRLSKKYTVVDFVLDKTPTTITNKISKNPFVPALKNDLDKRAEDILRIQTAGLIGRLKNCGIKKMVIGVSGGLDSTLALLVCCRAVDELNLPRKSVVAVTMPCFGTTKRTKSNAEKMCALLGVEFKTVYIGASVKQHLSDIGHDEVTTDVTYENAQARERTQVLFDIANSLGGILVGTGDLSELALGWCTYNGDHMSSYAVNASVPKTLVRHLVAYEAERLPELKTVLLDVLDTPVSPELLPTANDEVVQPTEDIVGPYELHDFFLYHFIRWGSAKSKIRRLANYVFNGVYTPDVIDKWLNLFFKRFFGSAFKRSCLPDGAKVGSVSLSPRGDWRMPSDSSIIE